MGKSRELLNNIVQRETKAGHGALKAFAKASEVSVMQLRRIRDGSDTSLDTLDKIAAALETTPADLLGGVSDPPDVQVLRNELRTAQDEILALKVEIARLREATGNQPGTMRELSANSGEISRLSPEEAALLEAFRALHDADRPNYLASLKNAAALAVRERAKATEKVRK